MSGSTSKYKLSRRGRKLQISDDQRTIIALPKDIPERTWMEIFQKEETDLMIFDVREEIVEAAIQFCYEKYMEKQNAIFTAHCAGQAWLKLINWYFYRHDPGEDPSAYPPCFIPNREESWIPDEMPDPSPKDTWSQQNLAVAEETQDEALQKWISSSSLDYPIEEEIPREYWFPGKVQLSSEIRLRLDIDREISYGYVQESSGTVATQSEEKIGTESEVLQKVTDYSAEELSKVSTMSVLRNTTPVDGSLHGAGDSTMVRVKGRKLADRKDKNMSRSFHANNMRASSRGSKMLPPLDHTDSRSRISIISDCRLRNLRLDTHFEISSEIMDSPYGEVTKRK
ncbi:unnamed protein product [Arctia plantaginis]|uniref:Uncharacterized protein n=1 Tax=Arctia plantaginis TaxID=874455 RepID=A0A8S0ZCC0_ARCPL|nr:unnamed protein product [Arctia plantaginis]